MPLYIIVPMGTEGFEILAGVDAEGRPAGTGALGKAVIYVDDRPGVLSDLASAFGAHGANITLFHYNRSEHPNRAPSFSSRTR